MTCPSAATLTSYPPGSSHEYDSAPLCNPGAGNSLLSCRAFQNIQLTANRQTRDLTVTTDDLQWVDDITVELGKLVEEQRSLPDQVPCLDCEAVVEDTIYLLRSLAEFLPANLAEPFMCPAGTRGLHFEWQMGARHAEMEIFPDRILLLKEEIIDGHEETFQTEQLSRTSSPLRHIRALLRWLAA